MAGRTGMRPPHEVTPNGKVSRSGPAVKNGCGGRPGRARGGGTGGAGCSGSGSVRKNHAAVRASQGTWQYIARARGGREMPVSRGDVDSLVKDFQAAMEVVDKQRVGSGEGGGGGDPTSPMKNDMVAIQDEVDQSFSARTSLVEAVEIMLSGGGGGVGTPESKRDAVLGGNPSMHLVEEDEAGHLGGGEDQLGLTGRWVLGATGMSPEGWSRCRIALGGCLFEQKWLDLTAGELCDQVSVLCLEHGQLLREIRTRYASVFNQLHTLYSDSLWVLDRCMSSMLEIRRDRRLAEDRWVARLADTRSGYEVKIQEIHASHESQALEQDLVKRDAKAQVSRMGETLRTLNGIFKNMQADGEAMTEADLKDRCRRLELELAEQSVELKELRSLKEKNIMLQAEALQYKRALEEAKMVAGKAREDMERQQSLLQEMMENEAKRLTEIEALKAGNDIVGRHDDGPGNQVKVDQAEDLRSGRLERVEGREQAEEEVEEDEGEEHEHENKEEDEEEEEEEEEEVGSSVLCIKCRKALDDLSNIAEALEMERQLKGQTRLQCHGYRLLLPNLEGHRPPRQIPWLRTVMRAILRAKVWDDSVLRYKQDLRVRFPEFVYSWFEPPRAIMARADSAAKSKLVAQADDDRWGLYYGVKGLARESAEATIFWNLLDESHGEDYLTFLIYCLAIVEGTVGSLLQEQWGITSTCTNLHTLTEKIAKESKGQGHEMRHGKPDTSGVGPVQMASGRDVVWLLLTDAIEAVDHVLVKALDDQKCKVLEATKAIAVSCEGRLPGQPPHAKCLDLFLFLRIMLHSYKEEQVNRRAAVRLMFETAATGVLTEGAPIYGEGRVDQSALAAAETVYNTLMSENKATVDLPQFMVIARTLWPDVNTSDAVAVFRDAHEESSGEVDYQAFLRLADRWQFFSNALQLPVHMPTRSDLGGSLDFETRRNLGALVHRHYFLMRPTMETIKETLPESATKQLVKCQRVVERELNDIASITSSTSSSHGLGHGHKKKSVAPRPETSIDGARPLAAYRRLLALLYHVRNIRHESGPGYQKQHRGMLVAQTEAEFMALEKASVFFDLDVDSRFSMYETLRLKLATIKVQRTWRRKLARCIDIPLSVLGLMRPGYMRGTGGIVTRRVSHPPSWSQQQVAQVYTAMLRAEVHTRRCGLPLRGPASGPSRRPLHRVVFDHLLQTWGRPELAERAAQDLFFNVRALSPALPRLRLFAAFMGCRPPEGASSSFEGDRDLYNEEAFAFYLKAVATIHRHRPKGGARSGGEGGVEGMGPKGNDELSRQEIKDCTDTTLR
ncbi:unnamed protein product [Discosporangium mesarthrocarpum]